MQYGSCPIEFRGVASEYDECRFDSGSEYHGLCPDDEHHALWHVQVDGESDGDCGHCCRDGNADSDALYPDDGGSLDARFADRPDREHASFVEFL